MIASVRLPIKPRVLFMEEDIVPVSNTELIRPRERRRLDVKLIDSDRFALNEINLLNTDEIVIASVRLPIKPRVLFNEEVNEDASVRLETTRLVLPNEEDIVPVSVSVPVELLLLPKREVRLIDSVRFDMKDTTLAKIEFEPKGEPPKGEAPSSISLLS